MKLFLASSFAQTSKLLEQKLQKPIKGKKIIFIANPADYSTGDKWWIKADRDAFIKLGCDVIDVDLRIISEKDLKKYLETSDIIHFCGGSVFYTILIIKERGFDKIIKEFVEKDKIIYSGTSAGSMIVSEDLSLDASDPEEKQAVEKLKDYFGLGLVNFLIVPHSNNKDFVEGNTEMIKLLPKYPVPTIFISDNQVVWVENNKFEILSN